MCNYATRQVAAADPLVLTILQRCSRWTSISVLRRDLDLEDAPSLRRLIATLVDTGLLEASDRPRDPRAGAMERLDPWNPFAGFFHTFTRDVRFVSTRESRRMSREQAAGAGVPAPVKRYRGAATIDLPAPRDEGEFPSVLKARRTWRRYSRQPVSVDELATLLGLAAGVQYWVRTGSFRTARTSRRAAA